MGYWTGTYTAAANRLKDVWKISTGSNVADPFLDKINAAKDWLWQRADWDYLSTKVDISSSLVNKSFTLPDDFGRFRNLGVYSDTNGDGIAECFYQLRSRDILKRYDIEDQFDKGSGHSLIMTFSSTPLSTCYGEYIKVLDDFTGSGTEYSFFPDSLLFLAAWMIVLKEEGTADARISVVDSQLTEQLRDFIKAHQAKNIDTTNHLRDSRGQLVYVEPYSSDGANDFANSYRSPYNNDYVY